MTLSKKLLTQTAVLATALSLALGVNYLYAWTGPTNTAPTGNVSAPINVGASDQIKAAGLSVNALTVYGSQYIQNKLGVGMLPVGSVPAYTIDMLGGTGGGIRFSDGTIQSTASTGGGGGGSSQWVSGANGVIYYSGGRVGVGTSAPEVKFDVVGTIQADTLRLGPTRVYLCPTISVIGYPSNCTGALTAHDSCTYSSSGTNHGSFTKDNLVNCAPVNLYISTN